MDIGQIPGLRDWPQHRRVLAGAIAHFRHDSRVPGLMLGGSFAAGTVDFYSDVDLYVVAYDEEFAGVLAEKTEAASAAGRMITGFVPDHLGPGGDEMYIAVYEGPVKLDLNYVRRSAVKPYWNLAHRLILKDDDGAVSAAAHASAGVAPPPPTAAALTAVHNKFWTWCWYVFGKIARGELWEAFDGVQNMRKLAVLPLLEWEAHLPPEGFRRLELRVPDWRRQQLSATISRVDAVHLYHALQAEIGLFVELQERVHPRYGVAIDRTAAQTIRRAIDDAWTRLASAGNRVER
jgi:predicted nucleotidyltransferase